MTQTDCSPAHYGRAAAAAADAAERQHALAKPLQARYDYIIVGAGSAGCIIAAQLAAAGSEVLLLEGGGTNALAEIFDPGQDFGLLRAEQIERFDSASSSALNGRRMSVGGGRVLGGGSSVNSMTWIHGHRECFEEWSADGCDGWGPSDILPLFREIEDWEGGPDQWRGSGGPIQVRRPPRPTTLTEAFIEGQAAMGLEVLGDINAPARLGVGITNMNVTPEGLRCTSATGFLAPAWRLPNLTVLTGAFVTELTFDGDRCSGCRLLRRSRIHRVAAARETIVCAGAIRSPLLLLRSGVGEATTLRGLGLRVQADLSGVGANLQDHALITQVTLRARGSLPEPDPISNHSEAIAFFRSGKAPGSAPDVSVLLQDQPFPDPELERRCGPLPTLGRGFSLGPAVIRPTGRGSVRLAGSDWRTPPRIDNGLLKTAEDLHAAVRGIEHCRELISRPELNPFIESVMSPGEEISTTKDLVTFARGATNTYYHPVGTCRMGRGEDAVVDPELRVHGVNDLRVCDSSIMPTITSGPPNATCYAIGLKAARLLRGLSGRDGT